MARRYKADIPYVKKSQAEKAEPASEARASLPDLVVTPEASGHAPTVRVRRPRQSASKPRSISPPVISTPAPSAWNRMTDKVKSFYQAHKPTLPQKAMILGTLGLAGLVSFYSWNSEREQPRPLPIVQQATAPARASPAAPSAAAPGLAEPRASLKAASIEYKGAKYDISAIHNYTADQLERIVSKRGITGLYEALFGKGEGNIYKSDKMAALSKALYEDDEGILVDKGSRGDFNGDGIYDLVPKKNVRKLHSTYTAARAEDPKGVAALDDVVKTGFARGHIEFVIANLEEHSPVIVQREGNGEDPYRLRNSQIQSRVGYLVTKRTMLKNGGVRLSYDNASIEELARQYSVSSKHAKRLVRRAALS